MFEVTQKEQVELIVGAASSREIESSPAAGIPRGFFYGNSGIWASAEIFFRYSLKHYQKETLHGYN